MSITNQAIVNAIKNGLNEIHVRHKYDACSHAFEFTISTPSQLKLIKYRILAGHNDFVVLASSPLGVDPDDKEGMARVSEFICRANERMKAGNFEVSFLTGEIYFKIFVDCANIIPSTAMIQNAVTFPLAMFTSHGIGFISLLVSHAQAEEALDKVKEGETEALLALLGRKGKDVLAGLADIQSDDDDMDVYHPKGMMA